VGSIQAFPRKAPANTLADVWRAAATGSGAVRIREARLEDFAALRALQRQFAPHLPALTLRHLEARRHVFAPGQLVAVADGQLVGAASSLIVHWADGGAVPTWKGLSGEGSFITHDPNASTLYGAELFVDESRRGSSVARALLQSCRRTCRKLNLRRVVTTERLAGYADADPSTTPARYAMRIVWGDVADAAMGLRMSMGFQFCGVLQGFLPEDRDSLGNAALLAWLNPLYAPPGPPAFAQSERARKCA
jgi:GNAT superfamily N-acetyltransferase